MTMKTAALATAAALAALLCGCAAEDVNPPATPAASESAPPPAPPKKTQLQPTPFIERETGIIFPAWMGGLPRIGVERFGSPGLGLSVGYGERKGSGAKADVYVYNLGKKDIKDGCECESVQEAFTSSLSEMSRAEKKGLYKNLKFLSRGKTSLKMADGTELPALMAKASMSYPGGADFSSFLLVAGYRGNFLKLRFSFPASMGKEGEKLLSDFLRELGLRLNKSLKTDVDPETKETILKAVKEIEERPLSGGHMAMPALMAYARDSEDVTVAIDSGMMPWIESKAKCKHAGILLGAFVGGNVRAQLERGVCEDSPLEGLRCVFNAYSKIREEDKSFKVPEIERLMELDSKGGLQKILEGSRKAGK